MSLGLWVGPLQLGLLEEDEVFDDDEEADDGGEDFAALGVESFCG